MSNHFEEILQRLISVELKLSNHLKHHEHLVKWFIAPIITMTFGGVLVLIVSKFWG